MDKRVNIKYGILMLMMSVMLAMLMMMQKELVAAEIFVGGTLGQDTYWAGNNTYIVLETVTVPNNVTLEIEAGATLKFNQFTGLFVVGGQLYIHGSETDSIYLKPNYIHDHGWYWQGITLSTISQPGQVIISHAHIEKATRGINAASGNFIKIENSTVRDNQISGIHIDNGSDWEILNNRITGNENGIEMLSSEEGNQSANNRIKDNVISNTGVNIFLRSFESGVLADNLIENNLVKNALRGVWLFTTAGGVSINNSIHRNFIINNGHGNGGFGIILSADDVSVTENIFWNNQTAVDFSGAQQTVFSNNNLYQNNNGIAIRNNATDIQLRHNTFTGNSGDVLTFMASESMDFRYNNIMDNLRAEGIIRNLTPDDIFITNNFWGTTDEGEISLLMYDASDDPALGALVFVPFESHPDASSPVSAPRQVISQVINGQTKLSWSANPEIQTVAYRIHYGVFADYRFSDVVETPIPDTTYHLVQNDPGLIAVTAVLEGAGDADDPQLAGLESPFAFAVSYPYAGDDHAICATQPLFNIQQSTAPADRDSLVWRTSGDGNFSNRGIVRPVYFPGPGDRTSGEVMLSLNIYREGQPYTDAFALRLDPVPAVAAGPDAIILPDAAFFTEKATASSCTGVRWTTNGDGAFDEPDNLHTFYRPGDGDRTNGSVVLTLTGFSDHCGEASDSMTLMFREAHNLSGRLWAGPELIKNNPVIAYRLPVSDDLPEGGGLMLREMVFTDQDGNFEFDGLFAGQYILYAPADTFGHNDYLPAYHIGQNRWQHAFVHDLKGRMGDLDIRLIAKPVHLPYGSAAISGHFALPEETPAGLEIYCTPWFGDGTGDLCIEGLSNATILLFGESRQRIYAHALTDEHGHFSFANLPYGNYVLEAELPGFVSAVSEVISLSPAAGSISDIQFSITESNRIDISVPKQASSKTDITVFPNPTAGSFTVDGLTVSDRVLIYDFSGRIVQQITAMGTHASVRLDRPGTYMVVVHTAVGYRLHEKVFVY